MIQFTLQCDGNHRFESWFQSSAAFDKLLTSGMLSCPVCGTDKVEKAMMAPRVADSRSTSREGRDDRGSTGSGPALGPLSTPATPAEQALSALREKVEANSEFVGMNFASEARKMHSGEAPERSIHGQAKLEEARKLVEDGVPVMPLPFMPGRKTN